MKVICTIGAIRSPLGNDSVFENGMHARRAARELWRMGYSVICLPLNSFMMGGESLHHEQLLEGDLAIIAKCDGAVLLPGWSSSADSRAQRAFAVQRGIRLFYYDKDRPALREWAQP